MFILVSILFAVIGILLFIKSGEMPKSQGANIVVRIAAAGMIVLAGVLFYYVASGNIEFPLG